MFVVQCEYCGHSVKVPDEYEGPNVRCQQCGESFKLPDPPEREKARQSWRQQNRGGADPGPDYDWLNVVGQIYTGLGVTVMIVAVGAGVFYMGRAVAFTAYPMSEALFGLGVLAGGVLLAGGCFGMGQLFMAARDTARNAWWLRHHIATLRDEKFGGGDHAV